MEPTNINTQTIQPEHRKNKLKLAAFVLFLILASVASALGGYYFASSKISPTPKNQTDQTKDNVAEASSFHLVASEGYPFGTDKKIVVKLGVPNELQAIKYSSSIQDPGLADGDLGDKFNGEMGRWKLGRPTINDYDLDDISLVNIEDQWLKIATSGREDFFLETAPYLLPIPTPNMTAAQKQAFITQLKSETGQCISDEGSGFAIANAINVCVTPYQIKQALGSYSPVANIKGYGVIDGLHFVLAGTMMLSDDKEYTYDQQVKLQEEFKPDKLPSDTAAILDRYITALKQTTIAVEKR